MKKQLFVYAISLMTAASAAAQDANFSQQSQLPVFLNPANTGVFERGTRITGAFRNTSFNNSNAFTTGAIAAEKKITGKGVIDEGDALGIGVSGLFDQSNAGALKSNYIGVSIAYTKALNIAGTSKFSAGLQGVWATRRLDVNKLMFEDQFASGGYNSGIPSADAYRGGAVNYLDVNAGLAYRYAGKKSGFDLGAALFHAARPKEQFWGDGYRLPLRYTLHGGAYIGVGGSDQIHLSAIANRQGHINEYLVGGYFSKGVGAEATSLRLQLGSFYRVNSAVIPYVGIATADWHAGVTYDISAGSKTYTGYNARSLEFTMQYLF